ncbi:MAG: aspartate aminotransferase family protein [Rhodospirillales bacterium]|nr:aspartate aminotransferase family protein [Rhodospirillales bacterium]
MTALNPQSNLELAAQAREYIPGGVNSATRALNPPLVWKRAAGSRLTDAGGAEYLDYHAAFGPIILGHNHPVVNARVAASLNGVDLAGVGVAEAEIELARKLCRHVPGAEKALLCVTGSEATYNAVRVARAVTGRKKILKFQGCYHGWHDYVCMNVITPAEKLGGYDYGPGVLDEAAAQTIVVEFNCLDAVESAFSHHPGRIAAVIVEPIPHNIGCVLPRPGFLAGLQEVARRNGAVLIFDEVITGFRHGLGGYQKHCGVTPDLTTFAKSMANGYPCAALCGKAEIMDRFQTAGGDVFFAGTYNGHPTGVAAALATIELLEDGCVHERLFRDGAYIARELSAMLERLGFRAQVRQFGSVFVPYFMEGPIAGYTDLLRNDSEKDLRFRRGMMERGIFMLPIALKRNHLTAAHTAQDIARTLEAAEDVLKGMAAA